MKTIFEGNLTKLSSIADIPVSYFLGDNHNRISLNPLIGADVKISWNGEINCIHCGTFTKQSFHNGYCYHCFTTLPETDEGVFRPELDRSHEGISRDMEWAEQNSLIDHYVYLAITGNLKVGVTRHTQIPTRWIDQGAISAVKFAKTPYRQLAGLIEVELKKYVSDKTNVAEMLRATEHSVNLIAKKKELSGMLPAELKQFVSVDNNITSLVYPVSQNVEYKSGIKLKDLPEFEGKLIGIKAQYLIFENGLALNVRTHSGYRVKIQIT